MESHDREEERQVGPRPTCWFCDARFRVGDVVRDGILRARTESKGGPYRLYVCPECSRTNHCEKTPRGRWFSSPTFQPNLLDYLVGRLFLSSPEEFLKAAAWYRENEERRRYIFEREGDRRYSQQSFLRRFLPSVTPEPKTPPARGDDAAREESSRSESRKKESRKKRSRRRQERPTEEVYSSLIAPWKILGVHPEADEEEIRRAFHRLAVKYHPDKVYHLGSDFQRIAHRKFTELQRAYEQLLRLRGGN